MPKSKCANEGAISAVRCRQVDNSQSVAEIADHPVGGPLWAPKHVAPNGQDYLMRAASLQPAEIVRLLLDKGLDPHKDDGSGFNALANTFDRDAGAKSRLLIDAGSDVNIASTFAGKVKNGPLALTKMTPLMYAVIRPHPLPLGHGIAFKVPLLAHSPHWKTPPANERGDP